jgi:alkylation response protein AidB-like acyl-CoA dehydrogenase
MFELTEEEKLIRDTAREFAETRLTDRAVEYDKREKFPWENYTELGELGFMGILVPEEYGGSDLGDFVLVMVIEEVSRVCASTAVALSVHSSLVCRLIAMFGTDKQKAKYLPKLATGEHIGAYVVTEPDAGSDAASIQTSAVRNGDYYLLNGQKSWISTGAQSKCMVAFARTSKEGKPKDGITAFIIEPGFEGFSVGKQEKKLGIRASGTCQLVFEDMKVPAENVLGEVNGGFKIMMLGLDGGRIGIAAQALGIAQACLDASIKYSQERKQFGKFIGKFQGIKVKIANMATRIAASRLLVYNAAKLKNQGKPHTVEASMAKLYAAETANYCATEAVQIHGGVGYTKEFPVERYFRDAKVTEIYEGTSEIQRLVIAKHFLTELNR